VREHDIPSADGTSIRVWRTGQAGRDVLLCPGLGTMPEAWPHLARAEAAEDAGVPDDGHRLRVHSWYHRGTFGSARPVDPSRVGLADHVADALAVLDDAGIEKAVVMGWSVGVTVAAELAASHPDRVSGLLLVAGAPGDPFGAMLGVLGLPTDVRRKLTHTAARLIRDAGPLVNTVLHHIPVNGFTARLARHSGFMRPTSANADVVAAGRRFLSHDWAWYGALALALAEDNDPDLCGIRCPVTMLTGRYDLLADPRYSAKTIGALPQARVRVLPTSHFLPLEAPEALADELTKLIERVDAVQAAARWVDPPVHASTTKKPGPTPHPRPAPEESWPLPVR
jgi:pimeloyl-ACP methyl ester carboxylesterase